MIRRLPDAQPALSGLAAAFVPVAIPYVATPALILLGLSAGADLGVAFVAITLAIGIAMLVAKAAWLAPAGRWELPAKWAARLLGAVAVAACVLLVIDAVYDV